jgi:hypothetical protein
LRAEFGEDGLRAIRIMRKGFPAIGSDKVAADLLRRSLGAGLQLREAPSYWRAASRLEGIDRAKAPPWAASSPGRVCEWIADQLAASRERAQSYADAFGPRPTRQDLEDHARRYAELARISGGPRRR